jgi:hypothetical protein
MKNLKKINLLNIFAFSLFLFYITFNTGLHGDDYSVITRWTPENFLLLTPENLRLKISGVPDYLLFWWIYPTLGHDYQWCYDLIKWLAHLAATYMAWRFFSLFINIYRALIASLFFVLSPLHETTTYWYMTAPYIFWPCIILFSFYLININNLKSGTILGTLGAFSGYWSPPYVFGLSLIFFIRREYLKGILFITPGFLYVIYYFYIKFAFPFHEQRINPNINLELFSKGIILQLFGIIDSFIGPSALLKIYYSSLSIGLLSFIMAAVILVLSWRQVGKIDSAGIVNSNLNGLRDLLIGAVSVLALSLGMFALTGLYVPSTFNLGNRSLVYGSLTAAALIASLNTNRKNVIFIWLILILPVFGLSDYWKAWNHQQTNILHNIESHKGLRQLEKNDTLIVTGNTYKKLGPYSHIEFFSMPWVVNSIFKDFANVEHAVALSQTILLEQNVLKDVKFGISYPITGNIYIYDSEINTLTSGTKDDIESLIKERPQEIRHWVQFAKGTFIESSIVALSPRLQYLFVK